MTQELQDSGRNQEPNGTERDKWIAHWEERGQSWRTEPEIPHDRQLYLAERRRLGPDVARGIYPFKDVKLSRADVEWLISTVESDDTRYELDFRGADLQFADLHRLPLSGFRGGLKAEAWFSANSRQREMAAVHLEGANLSRAHLEEATLRSAHLEGTDLSYVHFERATLREAHFEGIQFTPFQSIGLPVTLPAADLRFAFFDRGTALQDVILGDKKHGSVRVADTRWGDVNLSGISWTKIKTLGDERVARQARTADGRKKAKHERIEEYEAAVRANRQLSTALRNEGMNEESDHFAFRAQVLYLQVLRRRHRFLHWAFSLILNMISGYGYRPERSLIAYLVSILVFGAVYYTLGQHFGPPFSPVGALVFSLTSFHGRGFFPGGVNLDDPITQISALEAFVGLMIEVSLIASFTQRFFAK